MKKILPKIFILAFLSINLLQAQDYTHEFSFYGGPTSIQTDFGERGDFASSHKNNSVTAGFSYYAHVFQTQTPWRDRYSLFDHMVLKADFLYTTTTGVEHFGKYVEGADPNATIDSSLSKKDILKNMVGEIQIITTGLSVDMHLFDLHNYFHNYYSKINPYLNLGIYYSFYQNDVSSNLGNWQENIHLLPAKYQTKDAINLEGGGTLAFNFGLGTRIKLAERMDIFTQFSWQVFMSDAIDGLQAQVVENKNNETMTSLVFGLTYHINFDKNM